MSNYSCLDTVARWTFGQWTAQLDIGRAEWTLDIWTSDQPSARAACRLPVRRSLTLQKAVDVNSDPIRATAKHTLPSQIPAIVCP